MALHDVNSEKKSVKLGGIFRNDCLQRGVRVVSAGAVLCAEISRFNHSCTQNVAHAWEDPYERVYAARGIKAREELCADCCCCITAWRLRANVRGS
ncbi:unnamed protein product [Amoebophrya sp. A25]|nr:unnamed protein product [Amoebophrya sp. A25]|eukprot:GSA25T00021953001.1